MTDLTTLAAAKLYSGIPGTADDALISALIASYSQWVRSVCNRDFTADNYEIWRDGRDSQSLLLPQYPVLAVSLVEIDGKSVAPQAQFDGPGFRFTDTAVILGAGQRFCLGRQNVHIFYSAGFLAVPADIAQAVNELVGLRYALRDKQGWTSKTLAGETVALSQRDMPSSVATALKQYSRKVPL